jgi:hypothetical protein
LKIRNRRNRKTNIIFWNFEDQKEWKNKGKTKEIFRTNILKQNKNLQAIRKQKKWKNRQKKSPKNLLILKETKKREKKH